MRVVSGSAKGRHLAPFKDPLIRPTSDRIREAIFNILSNLGGVVPGLFPFSDVLDLFAGTGALGIEALSRGALKGVFVESDIEALRVLEKNLKICNLLYKTKIMPIEASRALSILKSENRRFSLIFVDPPYNRSLVTETLKRLINNGLLTYNGIVVAEHSVREIPSERLGRLTLKDRRKYGKTMVSFYILGNSVGQSPNISNE